MYYAVLQEVPFFLKAFATIGAMKYFVWARARIGRGLGGGFLGRMGEARVGLRFNVNGVGAGSGGIASTCCGWLMHAQMPAKAGEVREAFATLSAAINGL